MSRIASWSFACVLAGAVTLGGMAPGVAAATTPDGYQRVSVDGAQLSLVIPDDWETRTVTRSAAKKLLKENPQMVEAGTTVEQLVASPLSSGVDLDGDTYPDRYLSVQLVGSSGVPSPDAAEAELVSFPGIRDVAAKRTTVVHKPALVVTYVQTLNRDDGTSVSAFGTTYMVAPRGRLVLLQFFRTDEFDDEALRLTDTIVESVRVKKS